MFKEQPYGRILVISLLVSRVENDKNLQFSGVSSWFQAPLIPRVPPSHIIKMMLITFMCVVSFVLGELWGNHSKYYVLK
jgi:antibiotic biosynthesis monooxygenase (ABM) superfamily enzyme